MIFLATELAGHLRAHLADEFTAFCFPQVKYVLTVGLDTEHEILAVFRNQPITLEVAIFIDELVIAASESVEVILIGHFFAAKLRTL